MQAFIFTKPDLFILETEICGGCVGLVVGKVDEGVFQPQDARQQYKTDEDDGCNKDSRAHVPHCSKERLQYTSHNVVNRFHSPCYAAVGPSVN